MRSLLSSGFAAICVIMPFDEGDHNGAAVWLRVINAIAQLLNSTPPGPVH
jgi:hypothetical protein